MSNAVSLGGTSGTFRVVVTWSLRGWMTSVSPSKIPSAKTVTARMIVKLFVDNSSSIWPPYENINMSILFTVYFIGYFVHTVNASIYS